MDSKWAKNELLKIRPKAKTSLKDINLLIECINNQDYEPMKSTVVYNKRSCEYCSLLEILC
jgi:hypothetical protein